MTRRTTRNAKNSQAKYDAAGNGRRIKSWSPPSSGPNRAIQGLQKIRDRTRDSSRNDWAAASATQKWTTNLVGVGITPRWEDERFFPLWTEHTKVADADGVLDAYGLQTLGVRSWFDSGEVFLRRRPRDLTLNLPAPVQFQLIEADFVPLLDTDTWPGLPVGNRIQQGIERNRFGRRIAYWMYREHPGDSLMSPTSDQLLRIPASEIRHVYEPARPGQLRGVSGLSAVLARLRSSMDFEDAVLDRQKLANLFVAFITRQMPDGADIDYDPDTGLPKFYDNNGTPMAGLQPGITQELAPGENVTFANPPEAGTTFSDYMRTTHVGTSAGVGLPYEVMSGDIQNVSDRTLRVIINEFRRFARQRQWQIIIPMLCQPMVEWWADAAALKGDISMADLKAAKAPTWSPEGWEYIHPVQDAQGKISLIDAGIVSRSQVIGERGDDPRTVDAERKKDKERADKLGLTPPPPAPPAAPTKPSPKALEREDLALRRERAEVQAIENPPPPPPPAPAFDRDEFAVAIGTAIARAHEGMREEFAARLEASEQRHAAEIARQHEALQTANSRPTVVEAPVVNLGDTHVAAPVVNVGVEPTPVNVAAPTVNITNDVQPAAVDVSVSLPDRKTTTDITRDRDGNIVDVVQTETTLK